MNNFLAIHQSIRYITGVLLIILQLVVKLPLSCSESLTSHLRNVQDRDPNSQENSSTVVLPVVSLISKMAT